MVKLRVHELVIFGLTAHDCTALVQGRPVLVETEQLGIDFKVAMLYADNVDAMLARLRGYGLPIDTPTRTADGPLMSVSPMKLKDLRAVVIKLARDSVLGTHDKPTTCPSCGAPGFASALHDAEAPKPGNWGICMGCTAPAVFDEHLQLRKPTESELALMGPALEAFVARAREHVQRTRAGQEPARGDA